jgi:8-oxo-dGTP diphosphatase
LTARGPVRVVAALIPERSVASGETRYLVQQRLPSGSRANLWEFPGGKVEPGESDEGALTRECQEELGVQLRVARRLWETVHAYHDFSVQLVLYGAQIVAGAPKPVGAQALRFCTPKEMTELPFCEADVPLLAALMRGEISA